MIHDPKYLAIALTALGIQSGKEYFFAGIEVYKLEGADGTDFVVVDGSRQIFSEAYDAAKNFANAVWALRCEKI